jgi:hypothetical protein
MLCVVTALLSAGACITGRLPDPPSGLFAAPEAVVRVVNGTTQAYRMSLVADLSVFELGTVSALDARDFTLTRQNLLGHSQFHLVAITRELSERRESEQFVLERGNTVRWILDATFSRVVNVR